MIQCRPFEFLLHSYCTLARVTTLLRAAAALRLGGAAFTSVGWTFDTREVSDVQTRSPRASPRDARHEFRTLGRRWSRSCGGSVKGGGDKIPDTGRRRSGWRGLYLLSPQISTLMPSPSPPPPPPPPTTMFRPRTATRWRAAQRARWGARSAACTWRQRGSPSIWIVNAQTGGSVTSACTVQGRPSRWSAPATSPAGNWV